MASGFIVLKDGRCFAPRWSIYDEVIRITIRELEEIEKGQELADWLKMQIPEPEDNEDNEIGWGFIDPRINNNIVNRELDLRALTDENQQLFWKAVQKGMDKLTNGAPNYSTLPVEFFEVFHKMFVLCNKGEPPMELTHWNKLADPCTEKKGPGWTNEESA